MNRNIGIATAYGYALSKGYTGTEEEFAEFMAGLPEAAAAAEASAQAAADVAGAAAQSESNAEAWAVGERDGEPVTIDDDTFNNNAKYYADSAGETVSAFTETTVPAAVQAVNTAGQTQIGAVNTAGQTAVNAVQQKGEDVLDELQDYADLPEDVADLKSALKSGSEADAIYHLGFYLDENGDLCQVEEETNNG